MIEWAINHLGTDTEEILLFLVDDKTNEVNKVKREDNVKTYSGKYGQNVEKDSQMRKECGLLKHEHIYLKHSVYSEDKSYRYMDSVLQDFTHQSKTNEEVY